MLWEDAGASLLQQQELMFGSGGSGGSGFRGGGTGSTQAWSPGEEDCLVDELPDHHMEYQPQQYGMLQSSLQGPQGFALAGQQLLGGSTWDQRMSAALMQQQQQQRMHSAAGQRAAASGAWLPGSPQQQQRSAFQSATPEAFRSRVQQPWQQDQSSESWENGQGSGSLYTGPTYGHNPWLQQQQQQQWADRSQAQQHSTSLPLLGVSQPYWAGNARQTMLSPLSRENSYTHPQEQLQQQLRRQGSWMAMPGSPAATPPPPIRFGGGGGCAHSPSAGRPGSASAVAASPVQGLTEAGSTMSDAGDWTDRPQGGQQWLQAPMQERGPSLPPQHAGGGSHGGGSPMRGSGGSGSLHTISEGAEWTDRMHSRAGGQVRVWG